MAEPMLSINAFIVRTLAGAPEGLSLVELDECVQAGLGVNMLADRRLSRRLQWLAQCGWLQHTPRVTGGPRVLWLLTPAACQELARGRQHLPARLDGAAAAPKPQPAPPRPAVGPVAPPPQFDRMHAPVLRLPAWQPARAGALDHLQCPSRGIDSGRPARPVHPTGDPR